MPSAPNRAPPLVVASRNESETLSKRGYGIVLFIDEKQRVWSANLSRARSRRASANAGERYGTPIGHWFGPQVACSAVPLRNIDPSLAFAFYCRDANEREALLASIGANGDDAEFQAITVVDKLPDYLRDDHQQNRSAAILVSFDGAADDADDNGVTSTQCIV